MENKTKFNRKFSIIIIIIQIVFLILFAFVVDYDDTAKPTRNEKSDADAKKTGYVDHFYSFFQEIHAMIFFGIGFLYAFMKRYGYMGVGMNMFLAAFSVQTALLIQNVWKLENGTIHINIVSLIWSDFAAASAMIALGAIFGKASPLQMVFFTIFETICYAMNEHFCFEYLKVLDMGESVALHLFAALFGLSATLIVDWKKNVKNNPNETTSYNSNIFCMIGTVFLWVYWPSFNSALAESDSQNRAAINTFLALTGSCITAFAMSSFLNKDQKFGLTHIQNSTLAGGVSISTTVNLMIYPTGALAIGGMAGILSVMGYKYMPKLLKKGIHDPCGVHSLHAIPGIFGGITGVILAATASKHTYGNSFRSLYPAMTPIINQTSVDLHSAENCLFTTNRSPFCQAGFQFFYIIITILTSIITGLLTGLILRFSFFDPLKEEDMYLDDVFWLTPKENETNPENRDKKLNQMNDTNGIDFLK